MPEQSIENLERRCPRLGSTISFRYCLISGENDDICWKILDCWWETVDIERYLKAHLSDADFHHLMAKAEKPKNKISSILEIAAKIKKNPI